ETPRRGNSRGGYERDRPQEGVYTSNFWDIELAVEMTDKGVIARPLSGLLIADGPEPSDLVPARDGTLIGRGGMFNGFEVTLGADGSLYGGLYPYRFARTGDVQMAKEEPLDEAADLVGDWGGAITTPMGPMIVTLSVTDAHV